MIILSLPFTQTSIESSVDSFIQMEVAQVVRDSCQCDFQESFISQGVFFCDEQEPTQIVYRANITSYGDYSADQLLDFIEEWVNQGATITSGVAIVTFDSDCPVRINDISDPVCAQTSTSVVTPTLTPSTLAVIAASVSVVVVIVVVTAAVIIILIICLVNRRKQM